MSSELTLQLPPESRVRRRTLLLLLPAAASAAWVAFLRSGRRPLPLASANGTGHPVELKNFAADGRDCGFILVRKVDKTDREWRAELSSSAYAVTRRQATEFAFANRYWNFHQAGIYRCICCGNALFSSKDKFNSGTGWPSFTAPVASENLTTRDDRSLAALRTEVLCRKCDAHLGHVFDDGPPPSGRRYCMNSAALSFVPFSNSVAQSS